MNKADKIDLKYIAISHYNDSGNAIFHDPPVIVEASDAFSATIQLDIENIKYIAVRPYKEKDDNLFDHE